MRCSITTNRAFFSANNDRPQDVAARLGVDPAVLVAANRDRYPGLKVGAVEHELGWIPFFLDRLDYTYTQRQGNANYTRYRNADRPSDFFRHNVFCSFQDDALGLQERHQVGLDGLMFGSDYPHTESTFPRSKEIMSERLAGIPREEQRKIVFENAARLYGFSH